MKFLLLMIAMAMSSVSAYEESWGLHKYGPAPLGHHGEVVDTPEVEIAKQKHYEALEGAIYHNKHPWYRTPGARVGQQLANGWKTRPALDNKINSQIIGRFGRVAGARSMDYGYEAYHSPYVVEIQPPVVVNPDGFLEDTPEVAYEKMKHLAAYEGIKQDSLRALAIQTKEEHEEDKDY